MTGLPDTVTVGPHTYRVEHDPRSDAELHGHDERGTCDPQRLTVRVATWLEGTAKAETLLHETLHAAWHAAGLDASPADEHAEQVVAALTPTLLAVLRTNPRLVAYFTA